MIADNSAVNGDTRKEADTDTSRSAIEAAVKGGDTNAKSMLDRLRMNENEITQSKSAKAPKEVLDLIVVIKITKSPEPLKLTQEEQDALKVKFKETLNKIKELNYNGSVVTRDI